MKVAHRAVLTLRRLLGKRAVSASARHAAYTPLSFDSVNVQANAFADLIESRFERLVDILLSYESFEVARDETERTLDILRNLHENSEYFKLRVNEIAAFLPRNQPLYAFTCFVIVPSLMAHRVHFRIPHSMRAFFPKLLELLEVNRLFPNVVVSDSTRLEFLRERSALRVHPITKESVPVTDAVIFTGTSVHAEQLRVVFDDRTLFITNGAGHNPVVVSSDADVAQAVDAVLTLQLYNQGQDCAAPNAILVHKSVFPAFRNTLVKQLASTGVGHYRDRTCRVGPIGDPTDLIRIQEFLIHNRAWLDTTTPGVIRAHDAIVEPTIVCKALKSGGNFKEIFAPIIFLQEYENDSELALYFEDPHYAHQAMYISVYGSSRYVSGLIGRDFNGKVLHDSGSVLFNTHLHAKGVERGTQPYGGYGIGASSLTIHGKTTSKPTLPQRDIYEHIAKPLLRHTSLQSYREALKKFTLIKEKNVEKLLHLLSQEKQAFNALPTSGLAYADMRAVKKEKGKRYAKLDEKSLYHLLEHPNVEYMGKLTVSDIELVRALRKLLSRRSALSEDEFSSLLYALAAKPGSTERENRTGQLAFFQHIYQLLFGTKSGPRLPQFLLDVDITKVQELLDI